MRPKWLNIYFLVPALLFLVSCLFLALAFPKGEPELWINRNAHLYSDIFFLYATEAGHGLFFAAVVIVLSFVRVGYAFVIALSGLTCSIVSGSLKHLIYADSPRPPKFFEGLDLHFVEGSQILYSNSFPSGHTMAAFAMFCLLSVFTRKHKWGFVYALLAISVGLSRVYLLKHFFIDVFTGGCIGLAIAFAAYKWLLPYADKLNYKLTHKGLVRLN